MREKIHLLRKKIHLRGDFDLSGGEYDDGFGTDEEEEDGEEGIRFR